MFHFKIIIMKWYNYGMGSRSRAVLACRVLAYSVLACRVLSCRVLA
jgi:hypothetical protein